MRDGLELAAPAARIRMTKRTRSEKIVVKSLALGLKNIFFIKILKDDKIPV